jgi:hypothetical protein
VRSLVAKAMEDVANFPPFLEFGSVMMEWIVGTPNEVRDAIIGSFMLQLLALFLSTDQLSCETSQQPRCCASSARSADAALCD